MHLALASDMIVRPALAFALLLSCAPAPAVAPALVPSSSSSTEPPSPKAPEIEVKAPARIRWVSSRVGPTKPTLEIKIVNPLARPLDVRNVRVALAVAHRESELRCNVEVGPEPDAREPKTLAPGTSYAFERTLDCELPLVGTYDVRIETTYGEPPSVPAVRTFQLRVTAPAREKPQPLNGAPALYGAIGASSLVTGASRVAVAIVNASGRAVEPPDMHLVFRVYKKGGAVPCEDEPLTLRLPTILAAGASHQESLQVGCLGFGPPGTYEVVATAVVGGVAKNATVIGRLWVDVTDDPSRRLPPLR